MTDQPQKVPKIEGFTINRVTAWWITCDACGDTELVYGEDMAATARHWATEHGVHEHGIRIDHSALPPGWDVEDQP